MVPNLYVTLDALPRLPNGKLNRLALPAPESVRGEMDYVPPRTKMEKLLAPVWAKVLELDKIGVHDNFFEFGGNSLMAVRLHRQLLPHFEGRFSVVDLFNHSTIGKLAAFLDEKASVQQEIPDAVRMRESRRNKAESMKQRLATRTTK
jgi:hypothetical protein